MLAKTGLSQRQVLIEVALDAKEIHFKIEQYILKAWQHEYEINKKANIYRTLEPEVSSRSKWNSRNRKQEVVVTRL